MQGSGIPKVFVLRSVVDITSGSVANYSNCEYRYLFYMAYVCNGCRFHVDCHCLGEFIFDFVDFFLRGYEFVAGADQSEFNGKLFCKGFCDFNYFLRRFKIKRHFGCLSINSSGTAPYVVVSDLLSDNNIGLFHRDVCASGNTGRDD